MLPPDAGGSAERPAGTARPPQQAADIARAAARAADVPRASKRVVIAGAGIAGLAAALRLRQAGWEPVVVERAAGRRSSGYLVNLVGWGYDAAERLGIIPALVASDLGFFTSILVKADGRHKLTLPAAVGADALGKRALTVFRGDLEAALYEAVRDVVEIRFDAAVVDVHQADDGVRVELADGTVEHADLLVGADGLHSSVRAAVFGPERDYRVDLHHVVGALPLDRIPVDVPEGASTTFIGPGRTAAVVNLGPGRSSAFFAYRAGDPDGELAAGPADALAEAFGDLGGGVPDVLRQVAAAPSSVYFDSVSQVVADRWSRGRVVLLGDAAWCVTLFAGYGAALALTGADQLGAALERHGDDVTTALARWESELRPETTKRQALARKGMYQFAPPSRAHVWMNDVMLRAFLLPGVRGLIRRSLQRANK